MEDLSKELRGIFDAHVYSMVGNHFGNPSSHIEGKEEYLLEVVNYVKDLSIGYAIWIREHSVPITEETFNVFLEEYPINLCASFNI